MSTAAASGHRGLVHEASIYASDAQLRERALPFVTEGLAAQEPTYVVLGPHGEGLVRRELSERPGLHYIPAAEAYLNPAATVMSYRDAITADVAAGAQRIRFVTEVPHPGTGSAWDWWGRYECAANEIYADLPVWAICTYDQRTTPAAVLDEVVRAHPYLSRAGGGHAPNGEYEQPAVFLANRSCAYRDPLEAGEPLVELTDPGLGEARRAAAEVAGAWFGPEAADNLALAVSEIVTNAKLHGRAPVSLRLWAGPDRVVAAIQDCGDGIQDVTLGLAPVDSGDGGGRGLWISNQLCDHLSIGRSDDGFVIRLVVGTPAVTY